MPARFVVVVVGRGTVTSTVVTGLVVVGRVVGRVAGTEVVDVDAPGMVEPAMVDTVGRGVLDDAPGIVPTVVGLVDVDAPGIVAIVAVGSVVETIDGGHGNSNQDDAVGEATSSGPQFDGLIPVNCNSVEERLSLARTANGHRPAHGLNQFTLKVMPFTPTGTEAIVWYQNPVFSSTTPTRTFESTNGALVSVTG